MLSCYIFHTFILNSGIHHAIILHAILNAIILHSIIPRASMLTIQSIPELLERFKKEIPSQLLSIKDNVP